MLQDYTLWTLTVQFSWGATPQTTLKLRVRWSAAVFLLFENPYFKPCVRSEYEKFSELNCRLAKCHLRPSEVIEGQKMENVQIPIEYSKLNVNQRSRVM